MLEKDPENVASEDETDEKSDGFDEEGNETDPDGEPTEEAETEPTQEDSDEDGSEEEAPEDSSEEPQDQEEEPKEDSIKDALTGEASETARSEFLFRKKKLKDKVANDPDSFTEKWRRKRLIRQGYVIYKVLDRDPKTGFYTLDVSLIKKSELPVGAVAATNEKNTYVLDKIKSSLWYQQTRQSIYDRTPDKRNLQFTARDAAIYMTCNKIDNALMVKWTDYSHINLKKLFLPIAAVVMIITLIVVWRMM